MLLVSNSMTNPLMQDNLNEYSIQLFTCAIVLPVATFLNVVSAALSTERTAALWMSLVCGAVCCLALVFRILERKIKAATRFLVACALLQAVFSQSWPAKAASLVSALLAVHHTFSKHTEALHTFSHRIYSNSFSHPQRQLVLLVMGLLAHLAASAFLYTTLENMTYHHSLYFCVTTFTTIGFGDFAPKNHVGRALLPLVASSGIALVAATIWSIRNLVLEIFTINLAAQYSKTFAGGVLDQNLPHRRYSDSHLHLATHSASQNQAILPIPNSSQILPNLTSNHVISPNLTKTKLPIPNLNRGVIPSNISGKNLNQGTSPNNSSRILLPMANSIMEILPNDSSRVLPIANNLNQEPESLLASLIDSERNSRPDITSPINHQRLTMSRSNRLPQVTLLTQQDFDSEHILHTTKRKIIAHIVTSLVILIVIGAISGGAFAYIEEWEYLDALYFIFVSLTTIGYGDLTLAHNSSQTLFMWFILVEICVSTYLASMVTELALDEWIVTVETIDRRINRYQLKETLKRKFQTPAVNGRLRSPSLNESQALLFEPSHAVDIMPSSSSPSLQRVFSVSIGRSQTHLYS